MRQITNESVKFTALTAAPATATDGINLATNYPENTMKPQKWIVTAVVSGGASDLYAWGMLGLSDSGESGGDDDSWGLINEKYGQWPGGKIGTGLAAGTYHWIIEDLGAFTNLYFQNSANTVVVYLTPIVETLQS